MNFNVSTLPASCLTDSVPFSILCFYFLRWYLPIVTAFGILGTVFCLVFLYLSKLFPKSMLLWLVSICIGDLMIICIEASWMIGKVYFKFDFRDLNNVFCFSHTFLSNYFFYWSAYMQTFMSVQRCVCTILPLRARYLFPYKRTLMVWSVITILLVIPHIYYFIFWRVRNGDCDPPSRTNYEFTSLCDMILWGIIPLSIMTISTGIICWTIRQPVISVSTIPTVSNNSLCTELNVRHKDPSFENLDMRKEPNVATLPKRNPKRDATNHVTYLLISMNVWYILTTYPLLIYFMILNFTTSTHLISDSNHKFYYYLFRSICYLNACSNWIFYCAAGNVFRKRAVEIAIHIFRQIQCK